jgi:hypothetical protein
MSAVCFYWEGSWPHAVPDISTVDATADKRNVTCEACLHALGSQKNDPAEIPEGEGEAGEVEIDFVPDEFGIRVTAVFGESSVVVEHSWDAAEEAATLIQALPNIMIAVQEALDAQEEA